MYTNFTYHNELSTDPLAHTGRFEYISPTNPSTSNTDTESLVRDLTFNLITSIFHLVAFLFILIPKSVKSSLRIFLMSLSIPGFIQNFAWAVVRIETIWFRGPLVAREPGCKCLLFTTSLAILCCQTTVSALTLNNYLAVSHPIVFKRMATPRKTFICVTLVWCLWMSVNIIDVLTKADNRKPCLPLIAMSPPLLLTQALVILLTTLTVAILNIKLVIQFWGKFKIHPGDSGLDHSEITTDVHLDYPSQALELTKTKNDGSLYFKVDDEAPSYVWSTHKSFTTNNYQNNSHNNTERVSCYCFPKIKDSLSLQERAKRHPIADEDTKPERLSTAAKSKQVSRMRRARAQSRVRNMAMTLLVLTVWNSIGYLPFMVCLLMAAANREAELSQVAKSVNDIAGTIIRLATIGNTFIYAWRFIRWKSVCSRS